MRKLTAGIFSVLLGLVSAGVADAAVVSTEYLNDVLEAELAKKQDVLTIDGEVTANSTNLVTSGAVATAIAGANTNITALQETVSENASSIELINADIDSILDTESGILTTSQTYADNIVSELAAGAVKTNTDAIAAEKSAREAADTQLQTNIDAKVAQTDYNTHVTNQAAIDAKQTEDIAKNTQAITILNGDENTTGSVKNEIKVLSDLLSGTTGNVSGLATQVSANATAIEKLNADAATTDSVRYLIDGALGTLDLADTAETGQFVTAVSQENGVITVSRRALVAADIPTVSIEKVDGLQEALNDRQVKLTNTDGAIVISQDGVISIATQGITSTMIKDEAIVEAKLAPDSVTSTKIKDGAVTAGKIAADAVSEATIVDGAVTANKIGAGAITNEKLGAQAVKGANIENNAVGAQQLAADVNSLLTGAIQAPTSENAEGTFVLTAKKITGTDGKVTYEYAWEDIAGRTE